MKQRIMGIVSFIANIGLATFIIFLLTHDSIDPEELLFLIIMIFSCVSSIIYITWTNFGKKVFTELEKVENENKILKLKIEQNELTKRLDEQKLS